MSASFTMNLPSSARAETATKDGKGFLEKMEQWQDKMSDKFRDTWKGLRGDDKGKSGATASVDLREDTDRYTLRLNLPDRDLEKVEIKLEGDTLRIVAPEGNKAGRYEQSIALALVDEKAEPKIERRHTDQMIVVTLQKRSAVAGAKPSLTLPDPSLLPLSDWDREIFARMEEVRRGDRIRRALSRAGARYLFIEVQALSSTIMKRLAARERSTIETSDARLEDFPMLNISYQPATKLEAANLFSVKTARTSEALVVDVLKRLVGRAACKPR